jgi:hypothetical protein
MPTHGAKGIFISIQSGVLVNAVRRKGWRERGREEEREEKRREEVQIQDIR